MVMKKGSCGGTPRVGKVGDDKPGRGLLGKLLKGRGLGRRRRGR